MELSNNVTSAEDKNILLEHLIKSECLKHDPNGFTLKSGIVSSYYIDLRETTMYPQLFEHLVEILSKKIMALKSSASTSSTALVGVPYGVVPLAAALAYSCKLHYYPVRKEVKKYGHQPDTTKYNDFKFILIEDVMSTGSSIIETIEKMDGKQITDIIVIIDRGYGGREKLAEKYPNIKVHSIITTEDINARINL